MVLEVGIGVVELRIKPTTQHFCTTTDHDTIGRTLVLLFGVYVTPSLLPDFLGPENYCN